MMRDLNYLEQIKADIPGIEERFMGDMDFYFDCLEEFFNTTDLNTLKDALSKDDLKTAFESAHSIKGVVGNLGLRKLFGLIVPPVELLRNNCRDGVIESIKDFEKEFNTEKDLFLKE